MPQTIFLARAPVRVDPAGGGTDAPPFCVEHGGAVVNFGIGIHVHVRLEITPDSPAIRIISHDLDEEATARNLDELDTSGRLILLKGIARHLAPPWGFRLEVTSAAPPGSGLGSSGAVGVACVGAFDAAMGVRRTRAATAELANHIERHELHMAGGSQDSYGAALGGLNLIHYHRGGGTFARPLEVTPATRYELERRCVLAYTGDVHLSGSIHADIKASYALPDSPTVDAMQNLARIARASAAALEEGDVNRFGELLNDNWHHHRRLHPSCDNATLSRFYEAAEPHVVGGKTCGAGGGGVVMFLAKDGSSEALVEVCRDLGGVLYPFLLDREGLVSWRG